MNRTEMELASSGPQGNTKLPLGLFFQFYKAHVLIILQIPSYTDIMITELLLFCFGIH